MSVTGANGMASTNSSSMVSQWFIDWYWCSKIESLATKLMVDKGTIAVWTNLNVWKSHSEVHSNILRIFTMFVMSYCDCLKPDIYSSKVACMSSYILFLKFRTTRVNNSHASFVDCFMVLNVSQSPPTAHTDLPGLLHSPVCFRVSTLCTYTDQGIGGYFSIQHHSCFDLYLTCIIVVLYEISSYAEIYYIGSQLYLLLP